MSEVDDERQQLLSLPESEIQDDSLQVSEELGAGISQNEATMNIICVIAGTGLLQIPYSLSQGGWLSILLLALSAIVNTYTGKAIISCLGYKVPSFGRDIQSYPDIGEAAFGQNGRIFVQLFYNMALCGSVCLYLILASINLQEMFGLLSKQMWILALSLSLLIPFVFIKSIKEVSIVSLMGAFASFIIVLLVLIGGTLDYPIYQHSVEHKMIEFEHLGAVLGTYCFSFGGNYIYPGVFKSLGTQKDNFKPAMVNAVSVITVLYIITGVVGYAVYGEKSVSPILLNLPNTGGLRWISLVVITAHVILACPILLMTIASDVENGFSIETFPARAFIRTCIIVSLSTVSILLPYFADFLNLVGALSNVMLIFVLPVVCKFVLDRELGIPQSKSDLAIGGAVVIFGLIGGFFGTYEALLALYKDIVGN